MTINFQKFVMAMFVGMFVFAPSLVMSMTEVTNPTFYVFQLKYDGQNLSQTSKESPVPYFFYYGPLELSGSMTGRVVGLQGEVLQEFPYELTIDDNDVYVPYHADAAKVELLNQQNESIYNYDISNISTCNKNKICDSADGESNTTCPSDCKAADSNSGLGVMPLVIALIVVTIAFSGLIFFFWRKSKNNT